MAAMNLEVTSIQSIHPDFKLPTRSNGDPLEPVGMSVQGDYLAVRYLGWEPVSGPAVDEFFLDVFYNSEGREVFRVVSRIVEPPPEPPTLLQRVRYALCLIFNVRPQHSEARG